MLIGGGIGLFVALFFIVSSGGGRPEWGKFWMIQPLAVLIFAGAMGGFCNYIIVHFRGLFGISKAVAIILSILVFLFGIWMGIVLGLHGTMWN
jgi:hypothetical protein